MKNVLLLFFCLWFVKNVAAQDKKAAPKKEPARSDLPNLKTCIISGQQNAALYVQNNKDHAEEHDVNTIILDIEKYIDSMHKVRGYSDQLLMKLFNPMRHFFLTTTNKTSVATMFLYTSTPYQFCLYNDSATVLYLSAIKDGSAYNLSKMTENRIARLSFENCLLPSLKALDEFTDNEPRYIALSVYYGCKDTREGAPNGQLAAYCLTFIARTADLQQYAAGLITVKGLLANSETYLSDDASADNLRKVQISVE